jgi:hypothetical protein
VCPYRQVGRALHPMASVATAHERRHERIRTLTIVSQWRRVWLHLSTRSPWATLTLTGLGRLADLAPG